MSASCTRCAPALNVTVLRPQTANSLATVPISPCPKISLATHNGDSTCCRNADDQATQLTLWHRHVAIGQQELVAWSDCYPLHAIELQRSLTYQGGSHARRVIKRLASGNSMNIVVIGGSTALGVGARLGFGEKPGTPSTELFAHFLRMRYPHSQVSYQNMAIAGTTSQLRASGLGLEPVEAARPDLVIWDYSSNDYSSALANDPLGYRALMERLVRSVLHMKTRPALMLLSLVTTAFGQDEAKRRAWSMQDIVLQPVAERYHVPLVSYRDAIWHNFSHPLPRYRRNLKSAGGGGICDTNPDNIHHLRQSTHQLIADTLAHAWVAIDATSVTGSALSHTLDNVDDSIPSSLVFQPNDTLKAALADAATACPGGWLTKHVSLRQASDAGPKDAKVRSVPADVVKQVRPSRHWQPVQEPAVAWSFNESKAMKEGWQFDARRSRLYRERQQQGPRASEPPDGAFKDKMGLAIEWARRVDALEPITFALRFGDRPRAAVSFLKSYANFGRLIWWLDDGRERALAEYRRHLAWGLTCSHARAACKRMGGGWRKEHDCTRKWSFPSARWCRKLAWGLVDSVEPPRVIDARWEHLSSQTETIGLLEYTEDFSSVGAAISTFHLNASAPLATSGLHTVSFAMLWPDYTFEAMRLAEGLQQSNQSQHSNNQTECARGLCHEGLSFKLMGIFAC